MNGSTLKLERKDQRDPSDELDGVAITPPIDEDYWLFRVKLGTAGQAIVGFPKFATIGIGFAQEKDWNANLPFTCETEEIYEHIAHNKGDESISRDDCIGAIRLIQEAARVAREAKA